MHTHLDSDPEAGGYGFLEFTDAYWTVIAVPNARKTLKAGFTTARNVGSSDWSDVALKQAIEAGKIDGPRIVPAGYSFGATGGVFSHNTESGQQQLTPAEIKAVAEDVGPQGCSPCPRRFRHPRRGLASIDTIEHASLIDDEGIAAARKMGTWLSMDLYNTEYTQSEGAKNGVLEDNLCKDREIAEVQRQNFGKALKAGVKMVYGTDAGVYPRGDNARQFAVMIRYGAAPRQAIQTATINAADALGQKDKVGVIKPGAFGDLVGVTGDHLQNSGCWKNPPS